MGHVGNVRRIAGRDAGHEHILELIARVIDDPDTAGLFEGPYRFGELGDLFVGYQAQHADLCARKLAGHGLPQVTRHGGWFFRHDDWLFRHDDWLFRRDDWLFRRGRFHPWHFGRTLRGLGADDHCNDDVNHPGFLLWCQQRTGDGHQRAHQNHRPQDQERDGPHRQAPLLTRLFRRPCRWRGGRCHRCGCACLGGGRRC